MFPGLEVLCQGPHVMDETGSTPISGVTQLQPTGNEKETFQGGREEGKKGGREITRERPEISIVLNYCKADKGAPAGLTCFWRLRGTIHLPAPCCWQLPEFLGSRPLPSGKPATSLSQHPTPASSLHLPLMQTLVLMLGPIPIIQGDLPIPRSADESPSFQGRPWFPWA